MRSGGGTIEPEPRAAARVVGLLYGATTAHGLLWLGTAAGENAADTGTAHTLGAFLF